jgi:tellurite resistance protein TehA-like permease
VVTRAIRDLHPTYFAFVMATGIISTGAFLLGPSWFSQALLVIASIGFAGLVVALVIWLARYRSRVTAEFLAPERVFGFFAISASCDLLGVRYAAAGHPMVTTVLACVAGVVWFVLTYGVPASLLLARRRDSVLGGVDGTWLLWVVATQSLSVDASALLPALWTVVFPIGMYGVATLSFGKAAHLSFMEPLSRGVLWVAAAAWLLVAAAGLVRLARRPGSARPASDPARATQRQQ